VCSLTVPKLSGGVNASVDPTMIEDNELASAQNVRWKNGTLTKRQAVRAVGTTPFNEIQGDPQLSLTGTADSVLSHPMDIGGELCTLVHSGVRYGDSLTRESVQVISLGGEVKATYRVMDRHVQNAVFVPCDPTTYGCPFLMIRGCAVFKPDENTGAMVAVPDEELYAPLVMINGKSAVNAAAEDASAMANGVMYEGFNLLTRRYRARFTTQGGSGCEVFKMPTPLASGTTVSVDIVTSQGELFLQGKVGETVANGSYQLCVQPDGAVQMYPCPPASLVSDNLTVTATAAHTTVSQMEGGATLGVWFGGTQNKLGGTRLFLAGFAGEKAKVMWSDVNNPLYFPENNYMFVGDLAQRVTALEKQGDMLVIFKEREVYYTTYVQGEVDADSVANGTNVDVTVRGAHFPLTQLSPYIGCDAPASLAVCRDRLVWICTDGRVYTLVEGSPYSERNVRDIGRKIYPLTSAHDKALLKRASAMDYDGCYTVMIGNTAYSFNYSDSGMDAGRMAWYVYRFTAFAPYETLRLVSDGMHKAILISTQARTQLYSYIRMLYRFTEEAKDSHADIVVTGADGNSPLALKTTVTDAAISACLTTKTFDFGDIRCFKRIGALFLSADAEELTVRFTADGREAVAVHRLCADGRGGQLLLPCVKRCRTFSMTITSETAFGLRGMRVQYTTFGTVR